MANLETVHCLFRDAPAAWNAVQALKDASMEPQVRLVSQGSDDDAIEVSTECFADCSAEQHQNFSQRIKSGEHLLLVKGCDDPEKARDILKKFGACFD